MRAPASILFDTCYDYYSVHSSPRPISPLSGGAQMSPDTYSFTCPHCMIVLSVPRQLAGVQGPCPQCSAPIIAPPPPPLEPPSTVPHGPTPFDNIPRVSREEPMAPPPPAPSRPLPEPERYAGLEPAPASRKPMPLIIPVAAGYITLGLISAGGIYAWKRSHKTPAPTTALPARAKPEPVKPAPPSAQETPAPAPATVEAPPPPPAPSRIAAVPPPAPAAPQEALSPEVSIAPSQQVQPAPRVPDPTPATDITIRRAVETPSLLPPLPRESAGQPLIQFQSDKAAPAGNILDAPLQALNAFLSAPSWMDRVKYSQLPIRTRPEMEAYYKTHPDGPVKATSITFDDIGQSPDKKHRLATFHLTFEGNDTGFPVGVEETEEGWRVDWSTFVEFKDERLKQFYAGYTDQPATLKAQVSRAHYFDKDVPSRDQKLCFRIDPPGGGLGGYAFVNTDDNLVAAKIAGRIDWNTLCSWTVRLKWVKTQSGHAYVEMRDVVSSSWRPDQDPRLGRN